MTSLYLSSESKKMLQSYARFMFALVVLFVVARTSPGQDKEAALPIIDAHAHCIDPTQATLPIPSNSLLNLLPVPGQVAGCPKAKTLKEVKASSASEWAKNNVRFSVVSGGKNEAAIQAWAKENEQGSVRIIPSYCLPFYDKSWVDGDHKAMAEKWSEEIDQGKYGALGELIMGYNKIKVDAEFVWPYYAVAEEKGLPAFFHFGSLPIMNMEEWAKPLVLEKVADAFPNLVIVACHVGGGRNIQDTIKLMQRKKNVYTDISFLSGTNAQFTHEVLAEFKELGLLSRVLYGSDQLVWPGLISKSVENVKSSGLTAEELRMVFYSNAAKILRVAIDKQKSENVKPPN